MEKRRLAKIKSAVLLFAMLTFAVITVIEGIAIGQEQPNVEQPVLDISKTMITGDTIVPKKTRVYWELEISVSYDDQTDLSNVTVKDTLPSEIELLNITVSQGSAGTRDKKGSTKLTWTIGTMSPGDTETLTMWIATGLLPNGKKYHFTRQGEYILNEGAYVSGIHQTGTITAGPTDPIIVYAVPPGQGGR